MLYNLLEVGISLLSATVLHCWMASSKMRQ